MFPRRRTRGELLALLAADPAAVLAVLPGAEDGGSANLAVELLDFIGQDDLPPGGLELAGGLARRFPDDERFAEVELRYLAG